MSDTTLATYDELPYDSHPFAETHPNNLAAVATLFGMEPAPVENCRLLELGCAGGGNLIPMAEALPESRFVGIDLSRRQIADGQKIVAALGLTNLELRHASILDVGPDFGQFDYILCHGVYSWVPPLVQQKILEICRDNLAPQGVAHISYNLYPGWRLKGILRDWLCYRDRPDAAPALRVRHARTFLDFLGHSLEHVPGAYGQLLGQELALLRNQADSYLLHEHLEEVNHPVHFHEFIARARARGLQYLGEAQLFGMATSNFPPAVEAALRQLATDVVHLEQYMDFLRNRPFRETLLCQEEVKLDWTLKPDRLARLWLASPVRPVSPEPDLRSLEPVQFSRPDGFHVSTWDPLLKAALVVLGESWPRAVGFEELWSRTRARLGQPTDMQSGEVRALATHLLRCLTANLLELHASAPPFVGEVSEFPTASRWARVQAASMDKVTNRRHELVPLDPAERQVLQLLDGGHDRHALEEKLATIRDIGGVLTRLASCALLVQ
jgi:methyltransferase-like protein